MRCWARHEATNGPRTRHGSWAGSKAASTRAMAVWSKHLAKSSEMATACGPKASTAAAYSWRSVPASWRRRAQDCPV
eukprot:11085301-Alexandrium_andersonii.AAC.1